MTTRPIEAADITELVVRQGGGSLQLRPNDLPGVIGEVRGKRADEVTVESSGGTLTITTPRGWSNDCDISLAIPEGIDLTLMAGSADLTAEVGLGSARVRTGSGDITLEQVGNLDANAGSGDIQVADVVGSTARVNTGSGAISLASCDAALRVRSGSGDISIGQLRAILQGNTGSGELTIASTTGNVNARTGSGDVMIGIADDLPAWLDLSSSSGEVAVNLDQSAEPDPQSPYVAIQVRTGSGHITITRA